MSLWTRLVSPVLGRRFRRLTELAEGIAGYWPHLPVLESQIRESMQQVESAVTQVCGGFEDMAKRARESVSTAEHMLGSDRRSGVEKLLEASRHTLRELQSQIARGREVSAQAIERMSDLEKSAGVILAALGEIDRLSFGNRLVALNAKIEAAHFGDAGNAFGIVADSIAQQAQRSEEITSRLVTEMERVRANVSATSGDLTEMARISVDTLEASRSELEGSLAELIRTQAEMQEALAGSVANSEQLTAEIARSVVALQFQDQLSQRLGHVADELAAMRQTVNLPLEYLTKQMPVLGAAQRKEVGTRLEARYTMQAERDAARSLPKEQTELVDGVTLF